MTLRQYGNSLKWTVFSEHATNDLFWKLSQKGPAFSINPKDVEFLREPKDFYDHILVCCGEYVVRYECNVLS